MLNLTIPLRIESAPNLREHWATRARRVKAERMVVATFLGGRLRPGLPVVVTLTRVAPRAMDDDNLVAAFKAPRDQVAAWFGVADNHAGIEWRYGQQRGAPKVYAMRLCIEAAP